MEATVKLDLRRDFAEIYAHLVDRVRTFDPARNDGPGKPGPVKMIQVGFEYSQSAWVVVVFDTRRKAAPDGEWNSHIEGNELERPNWLAAGEANMKRSITLVQLEGTEVKLPKNTELAEPLGELVKAVLLKVRADGVFDGLPKADGCELGVEHHEGAYGWPKYEDRGRENLVVPRAPATGGRTASRGGGRPASEVARDANAEGTHLVGEVKLPPAFLVKRFGRHDGGDGRVSSGGWTFVGETGEVFTVYEMHGTTLWHGRGSGAPTIREFWQQWQPVRLHIGGRSDTDWKRFRKWLIAEHRAFVKSRKADA
jgi:hypothetical protein